MQSELILSEIIENVLLIMCPTSDDFEVSYDVPLHPRVTEVQ